MIIPTNVWASPNKTFLTEFCTTLKKEQEVKKKTRYAFCLLKLKKRRCGPSPYGSTKRFFWVAAKREALDIFVSALGTLLSSHRVI